MSTAMIGPAVMWLTRIPLAQTAAWQAFARMMYG